MILFLQSYCKLLFGVSLGTRDTSYPLSILWRWRHKNSSNREDGSSASRKVSVIFGLLAAGELVGDKLPSTPNRTEVPGLIARIISGAAGGGIVCARGRKSIPTGIAIGAAFSVAAAYAGQHIRQTITEESGIPTGVLGAIEDAIAIGIGVSSLKD